MNHLKKIALLFMTIVFIASCEKEEINILENSELNLQKNEVQNFQSKNLQSELTRIFLEEQEAQKKPIAERSELLSKLQAERDAIIEHLRNNAGHNTASSNGLYSKKNLASKSLNTIHVGSVSDSRSGGTSWTLDGGSMTTTLAKLSSLDNFGPSGTYSSQLSITHVTEELDAATLANFDIFFIGFWGDGTFSQAELDALFNWVNSGGNLIVTADDSSYDAVAERFGYPSVGSGSINHNAVLTAHPLFNGIFGLITSFNGAGSLGAFNQGSATLLATNSNGTPSILETTIGNGLVVLLSDVDMLSTWGGNLSAGSSITTNNDILLGNTFAYMVDNSYDSDNDGIPNEDDPHPRSNRSEEVNIGGFYSGVTNVFTAPGTTMMDEIDDVIAGVWDQMYSPNVRRNFDPQKQFQRDMDVLLNTWYRRYDRILSDADKFKIRQSVRKSRIFEDPI